MCNLVALFTPQYGIIQVKDLEMGRNKKSFYEEDLGRSISTKMRELDLEDRANLYGEFLELVTSDQEEEDWLERLYER